MTRTCAREMEVVQAVLGGRLERTSDLQVHVSACEACEEAAMVAALMRADRDASLADVHVPAAGQVWWRAAIRARLDATQAAARPLTWAHGVAGACAAGLTAAILTMAWSTIASFGGWLTERTDGLGPGALAATQLAAAMLQRTIPVGLAAALLLLAPIALYFAFADRDAPGR